ncbi:MAG: 3-methyl-2-oxobutanoate hydroxymethyltransferase [Trueperaceae bacterium]|nr:3-methyl-2-oxobutanoate hydroxymethyltransferase [Trueperaceae bacterium]
MKKLTVKDIFELKGKRQVTEVYVSTPTEASAAEAAGIDMIITSERNDVKAFREAAPHTFFTVGFINSGDYVNGDACIRNAFKALNIGADAVYAGVSLKSVEAMANEGIPVVGHVGFIPYKSTWFGGFKAVGKTTDSALKVYQRTLAYQEAGAIGVEMEIVPHRIAAEISKRVKILVLSMGSGTGCDGQYLFATDILGTNTGHVPRHAKVYRNLAAEYERLHKETIAAFKDFKADVATGGYPEAGHMVDIKNDEYQKFMEMLEQIPSQGDIKEFL